jgi:hypothetical protein
MKNLSKNIGLLLLAVGASLNASASCEKEIQDNISAIKEARSDYPATQQTAESEVRKSVSESKTMYSQFTKQQKAEALANYEKWLAEEVKNTYPRKGSTKVMYTNNLRDMCVLKSIP